MSRDKQIEEMAKLMCEDCARDGACRVAKSGEMCDSVLEQAKWLYNAGYRKSTEVAEEIFEEIENTLKAVLALLQFSYMDNHQKIQCKENCYKDMLGYIAELKKKYTEEGK